MKLLRRKGDKSPGGKPRPVDSEENGPLITHRLTMGLTRAEKLSLMLASSRAARAVEVADLLGGMYLYDWDRLSKFWPDAMHDATESLLRRICRISPQRWHYWIELYDSQRQAGGRLRSWRALQRLALMREDEPAKKKPLPQSAALRAIFAQAERLAPFRDFVGEKRIPVLTTECVLLCIVRNSVSIGSELSRKLLETDLDIVKLERAALTPSRPPLR
jgi:hypothetical protein